MPNVFALVMAGGSGTRFWPASRRSRPKQLLAIAPGTDESLIAQTVRRIAPLCPKEHVVIATGAHLVEATRSALPGLPARAFLGEPVPRNTAACIGWGTAHVARSDPNAVIMALPSDHQIGDERRFVEAAKRAIDHAATGVITTLGIEPTHAETGYGYIEAGEASADGVRAVRRFVEKPDRETAERYLAADNYFWNSGMFFFRAADMLQAIERHMPDLAEGLRRIDEAALRQPSDEARVTTQVFESLASVSIDFGVMEKVTPLAVVPSSFGWSDLGSWGAAFDLSEKDEADNAAEPGTVLVDARRNLVRDLRTDAGPRVIALLGVEDLCIVETDDALLVMPRERAQDVRQVVDALRRGGREDAT